MIPDDVGLQDGMLAHYNDQARASDVNVEARLDREPFDYREYNKRVEEKYPSALSGAPLNVQQVRTAIRQADAITKEITKYITDDLNEYREI